MKYKIAASILSADFGKLSQEIKTVEQYGIDMIHVDVMDGHFVPNITIGPQVVKSLRKNTNSILDTHLMIENPEKYIKAFADAGSDIITFHYECGCNIEETIKLIKSFNKKVGISINPDTPLEKISKYIFDLDMILLMKNEINKSIKKIEESNFDGNLGTINDFVQDNY